MIFADSSIFSLSNIISFLLGIVTGATLLFALFAIIIASDKKKSKKISGPTVEKLKEDQVKELIENKKNEFIRLVEEEDKDYLKTVMSLTLELLHEISSYYFPDSMYPEYELTISEAGDLIHYIVNQVIKQLDRPILRQLENIKISTIAKRVEQGRKAANSKIVKSAKESSDATGKARTILNMMNPIMWFRKTVVKGTVNIAIKKLCKAELTIAGHEIDKVYSKSLFKVDDATDVDNIEKEDIEEIFTDEN